MATEEGGNIDSLVSIICKDALERRNFKSKCEEFLTMCLSQLVGKAMRTDFTRETLHTDTVKNVCQILFTRGYRRVLQ